MSQLVTNEEADAEAALTERQQTGEWFAIHPDNAHPATWIVCSHVRIPRGHFAQSRVFSHLEGTKIFLNAPDNDWYSRGVPGAAESLPALAKWLESHLWDRAPEHVTFVGHSMGAHLAIALSSFFPRSSFVATSPELTTGLPGSRSRDNGVSRNHPFGDLFRFMPARAASKRSLSVFGLYDGVDAYFLGRAQSQDGRFGKVYSAPHHHGVTEYLTSNRYYLSLLVNRRAYADALVDKGGLRHAPDDAERSRLWTFAEFQQAVVRGQLDRAEKLASRYPDWSNAGWSSERASLYQRLGKPQQALAAARKALLVAPHIKEYALQLARYGAACGDQDAVATAERAMKEKCAPHRAIEQYFAQKQDR